MEKIPEGTARDCSRGVYSLGVSAPGGGGCLLLEGVGGCLLWGVSAPGGVCSRGCLLLVGVCSLGCLLLGVSTPGGCLLLGGVCSWGWGVSAPGGASALEGGRVVSQHALRQTPTPVNRITHACENITLPQLRCGR